MTGFQGWHAAALVCVVVGGATMPTVLYRKQHSKAGADSASPAQQQPAAEDSGGPHSPAPVPPRESVPAAAGGRSMCYSVEGFAAQQPCPIRSPMLLADHLAPLIKGRSYCEVGTRDGDHIWCLSKTGAARVTGFEVLATHCAAASARGVPMHCGNFLTQPPERLTPCDDFFWWPEDPEQTRCFLSYLYLQTKADDMKRMRVYVATDFQYEADKTCFYEDAAAWGGRMIANVTFNETEDSLPAIQRLPLASPRWFQFLASRLVGTFTLSQFSMDPSRRDAAERVFHSPNCSKFMNPNPFEQATWLARPGRGRRGRRRRR